MMNVRTIGRDSPFMNVEYAEKTWRSVLMMFVDVRMLDVRHSTVLPSVPRNPGPSLAIRFGGARRLRFGVIPWFVVAASFSAMDLWNSES